MSEENNINSWDGLLTNYLKAENIPGDIGSDAVVVCYSVKRKEDKLDLNVEYAEKKWLFSLNKTNMAFLKTKGIQAPKEIIGKKLTLQKSVAMNPTSKKEVPTLRISKINK